MSPLSNSLILLVMKYISSTIKTRVLYAVAGLLCATFIGLAAPIPQPLEAQGLAPTHIVITYETDDCDPSACTIFGTDPARGLRHACTYTCDGKAIGNPDVYVCCDGAFSVCLYCFGNGG